MPTITPFLWFDDKAEEAMDFYVSIFENSKIKAATQYGDGDPVQPGRLIVGEFQLEGQDFIALNGGPLFKFTEAISLVVSCGTQEEIDYFWDRLSEGGEESRCGWLKDKYGLSWQIVPTIMGQLMKSNDPDKKNRVMQAMLKMDKLEIEPLRQAYER